METVKEKFGLPEVQVHSETVPNCRVLGVEVEVENFDGDRSKVFKSFWKSQNDGSLRKGTEFVSVPTDFKTFCGKALPAIVDCKYNISPRCGTHVHVNIQDFNDNQLKALWVYWLTLEKNVYDFCGKSRKNSVFCVPIMDTKLWEKLLSMSSLRIHKDYKYLGMSFFRAMDLGTVEFRMFPGLISTTSSSNVTSFVSYLRSLVKLVDFSYNTGGTLNKKNYLENLETLCEDSIFKIDFEHSLVGRSLLA